MKVESVNKNSRLGLDFGRVIMGAMIQGKADTSFLGSRLEDAIMSPETDGVFEAVKRLVEEFEGRVWIISKCGPSVQKKTRAWLEHHRFGQRTGWDSEKLRFCLQRPEKADICRELGVTHFVDDRLDVLQAMSAVVPHRYLFGEQAPELRIPGDVIHVLNWKSTVERLCQVPEEKEVE